MAGRPDRDAGRGRDAASTSPGAGGGDVGRPAPVRRDVARRRRRRRGRDPVAEALVGEPASARQRVVGLRPGRGDEQRVAEPAPSATTFVRLVR